jgi:hypothetical protein
MHGLVCFIVVCFHLLCTQKRIFILKMCFYESLLILTFMKIGVIDHIFNKWTNYICKLTHCRH